ncbi:hypothetical protein [Maribellus mangrovi]|uniref:hypothetical protein n=1 Tax=Maribellus mangrovi TaxID=3133146 RepID=UPI0030EBAAE2
MKSTTLRISFIFMIFALIGASCQDDEDLFELQIGDENAIIQKEVNGIEFKFCLLNEAGEFATVFNEGENFTFQFSFTNHTTDTITVTSEFINDEFFRVIQINDLNHTDKGKPYTGTWCYYRVETTNFTSKPDQEISIICPWEKIQSVKTYPLCISESREPLDIGRYYTKLNLDFHYTTGKKEFVIKNKQFQINFEIK